MNIKIIIYALISLITIIALDSININAIFKKNKVFQARLFYFLLALAIIYLVTNIIYDWISIINIF